MEEREFFNNLGFDSNPFQFTNADDEERLKNYFIPPPYFNSVWGDPKSPKSVTVFAPRGGGKTAQRKMIEYECVKNENVLCVNYSDFDFSKEPKDITLNDHLGKIIPSIILGILTKLNQNPDLAKRLDETDKLYLKHLVEVHIGNLSERELSNAINSLSNYSDKAKKIWNEHLFSINIALNLVLSRLGSKDQDLKKLDTSPKFDETLKHQFKKIPLIALKMNFSSIYILIDKVDESEKTGNNAELSAKFIEPLLKDLDILETKGYGFKFFLWDKLLQYYDKYGRKDRVEFYSLKWTDTDLKSMISKRLEEYSNHNITDLSQIIDPKSNIDINDLVILFAQKSPRDVIRIVQNIIAEQREIDQNVRRISHNAIIKGIDNFCKQKLSDLAIGDFATGLKKIGKMEFTVNYLVNEVYKCSNSNVSNKIKKWLNFGFIEGIGKVKQGRVKQGKGTFVNLYCISDLIVARNILSEMPVEQFLKQKCKKCPSCGKYLLRDWDVVQEKVCHYCSSRIEDINICKKRVMITPTQKNKNIDKDQVTLFEF